jgi:hypothetical protein
MRTFVIIAAAAGLTASGMPLLAKPPVMIVGQCTITRISRLESRLQGMPSSGSAVAYANGVYGVSYDLVPAVRQSRVGDPVRVCLMVLPRNCPKGDDRGKIYAALDLRTLEGWVMSDSEHSCGGA